MKKILIALLGVLVFGCKKDPFDYRTKFIGDYTIAIHESSYWGIPPNTGSLDTTYFFDANISNGSDKNSITISSPYISLHTIVYEDGSLEGYKDNNGIGEFTSEKEIKYSWGSYAPGGSTTYTLTGKMK